MALPALPFGNSQQRRFNGLAMPFKKGQSGNPGGRKRIPKHVEELARQHTADAINALVAALAEPRERVAAAVALLNRAWGQPKQAIEATVKNVDPNSLTDADLLAYLGRNGGSHPAETPNDPSKLN
jgi:hypothetical protein